MDPQLQHYVESMKGKLISTSRVSRVNVHRGEAAKLDHIMLWMMEAQDEEGTSEWQGEAEHDHARVQFRVGEDLLGHRCRRCGNLPKRTTKLSGETIESIREDLNLSTSPPAGDTLMAVRSETMDTEEGCDEVIQRRKDTALALAGLNKEVRGEAQPKRGPHRDVEQRIIRRELALLQAARKAREGKNDGQMTAAEEKCLKLFEFP